MNPFLDGCQPLARVGILFNQPHDECGLGVGLGPALLPVFQGTRVGAQIAGEHSAGQPQAIAQGNDFGCFDFYALLRFVTENSPLAMRCCHWAGPVMWALVPPASTATVTGISTTSNS